MPKRDFPLLVTFTDIDDPKTVRKVDPNNLAATLGPGYALKSITLEITDEPVTKGKVEEVLGWWLKMAQTPKDPPPLRLPNESPRGYVNLGVMSFWSLSAYQAIKEKYQ